MPQLHRLILEALPLMICVVNRQGKVLLWSAGAEQITGYFRQELWAGHFLTICCRKTRIIDRTSTRLALRYSKHTRRPPNRRSYVSTQ